MATVTIRGSITPSSRLARGEVITVQDTPQVRAFIAAGWADLIEEHDTPQGKVVSPEPPVAPPAAPVDPPAPDPEPPTVPAKTASRDAWAEFLATTPLADHVEDRGRDELVGMWEQYEDDHPAAQA